MAVRTYSETLSCRRVPLLQVLSVLLVSLTSAPLAWLAEKFWAWLRNRLRQRDPEDLQAGRPALGKTAFKARVRAICRSQHARRVAAACALGLRKVCLEVIAKKGAMARS